ncbi:tyrosinase [Colletotrichum karsti]|uniref:tyrosinase n=1 Tax=Colletotrichum karsti TaxID=1095194 RepID=A0A9P6LG49_9PEZI|nr:tyrosinase [Colletotrichum karsti]KAF9872158.1 tyrosinase [Colletotrichum karsti]
MVSLRNLVFTLAVCLLSAPAEAQRGGPQQRPGRGPPPRGRPPPGPPAPGPPGPGRAGPAPAPNPVPQAPASQPPAPQQSSPTAQISVQASTGAPQRPAATTSSSAPSVAAVSSSSSSKQAQPSASPNGPYAITGLKTGIDSTSGQRPLRKNINDLQSSGAQWDLYILGLAAMQRDEPENDKLSYFQISGIHGRPFIPWNGVQAVSGGSGGGYCPHGNVQFPMWHRPYVALFEQVLGGHIQAIAANYTGSRAQEYKTAADNWRTPYWDWAADGGAQLPAVTTQATLTVNGPGGPVQLANPLLGYKWQSFPLNSASNYFPKSGDRNLWSWPQTTRYPDRNGNNRPTLANQQLSQDDLKASTYNVFSTATDFETMASTGSSGNSFEAVHNSVHGAIYAVMAYIEYAAFDPVFMLHHTNIDRLISMWQAIHYTNKLQTRTLPSDALFATAANTPITADSPLKPFYRDTSGNFHTGRTVSDIKTFGYSYPEISDWNQTPDALAKQVTVSVNRLYGPGGSGAKKVKARHNHNHRRSGCGSKKGKTGSAPSTPAYGTGSGAAPATHKEFTASVDLERSELPLPCSVSVYVNGEFAGKISVMSMPTSGIMHSTVPLNKALEKLGKSMEITAPQANSTIPATNGTAAQQPVVSSEDREIIQKQLSVEIQSVDGTIFPVSSAPSLKIKVELQHVATPLSEDSLPVFTPVAVGPLAKPTEYSTSY